MTKTQTSLPSDEVLRKAANLLQRAHDLIEAYGYDINQYGPNRSQAEQGAWIPMCYIGSVRAAANLDADVDYVAAVGDGPELIEALKTMDRIAKRRLNKETRHEVISGQVSNRSSTIDTLTYLKNDPYARKGDNMDERVAEIEAALEYPDDLWTVGRFVEKLGFEIEDRADKRIKDHGERAEYQRDYALKLLRKALTEIHTRLGVE